MENLKEVKETLGLLDSAYNQYYETGESISPELIDEAREILRSLIHKKLYEVEVVTVTSNYEKYDSYQFLGQEVSRSMASTIYSYSQARLYTLMEINARRERLGMPAIKENQIDFHKFFNRA